MPNPPHLPEALTERMRSILGDEYGDYLASVGSAPRPCLRVNTLKSSVGEIRKAVKDLNLSLESVPWCPSGFWLKESSEPLEKHGIGGSVEHFQGLFYLQDAASLLPPEALASSESDVVLDAAAAPGGKTTHLAALMGNRGVLVANEVDPHRTRVLRFNLNRMGVVNAAVTTIDMGHPPDIGPIFDKVLLDAPCSCEGRIGEDPEALSIWSLSRVRRCSRLQVRLAEACYGMLKPGGTFVYSTCTLSPEEDEGVVDGLLRRHKDAEVEEIAGWRGERAAGITEWAGDSYDVSLEKCFRIYPHHYGTQGFFVAKVRRCP